MSYADSGQGRERIVAIGLVGLVQGGIIAALVSGLAVHVMKKQIDPPITIYSVPETPPPPFDPPPPTQLPKQVSSTDPKPVVPVPLVPTDRSSTFPVTTEILPPAPLLPSLPGPLADPAPPQPPAVDLTRGAMTKGDVGAWFPRSDYPASSLRAGIEGRVTVAVEISAAGRATACEVVVGSGDQALDQATCRLAIRNGRFEPARSAAGSHIGTRLVLPAVRWRLED